jgi:hypothetical protein
MPSISLMTACTCSSVASFFITTSISLSSLP